MARYVSVRMTVEQAAAAENACDLIRDNHEASNERRQAAIYARAASAIRRALEAADG